MVKYDEAIETIATYVLKNPTYSDEAYSTARYCLLDALGCALLALNFPACTKFLGPFVPGTDVAHGCRIPGTLYRLDPVQAAFQTGLLIRWLDYSDTWLGAEWAHPSDNIGGLLAICEWKKLNLQDLLNALIKAYEIQGILALTNSYNRIGFDHVAFVKVATAAVATQLLRGSHEQICAAISQAFIDVTSLRTYRHAPNTGSRKSWAAGDATARGVQLALWTMRGEMGYPAALTAPTWGLYDVLFEGKPFTFQRPLESYVVENILFKVAFPAEFHAQTAVEAAIHLHPHVIERLDEIERIEIETHASALRIIDKQGPLTNPADRDHCLQYMIAIALLHGSLQAEHYEEKAAQDPRIDPLRQKMTLKENPRYSSDYHHPDKRSIANALTVFFKDGTHLETLEIEFPLGHRQRRQEGLPLLESKCLANLATRLGPLHAEIAFDALRSAPPTTPVSRLLDYLTIF